MKCYYCCDIPLESSFLKLFFPTINAVLNLFKGNGDFEILTFTLAATFLFYIQNSSASSKQM